MSKEKWADKKLRVAVTGNKYNEVSALVLQAKANPGLNNGELLLLAAKLGHPNMVLWLMRLGAPPAKLKDCISELEAKGHVKGAELLLKHVHKLELEGKL